MRPLCLPTFIALLTPALLTPALCACSSDHAGGAASTGGSTTAAGSPSTGGAPGSGGSLPSGGSSGSGGSVVPGNGGALGSGGDTGSGGTLTSGGVGGSGGAPAALCPTSATAQAGDTSVTLQSGGLTRQFYLHVPASYDGMTAMPLVIDLHPFLNFVQGDAAASQRDSSGYKQLSDTEGFIVAWPNGIDRAWNMGTCCTQSRAVDDLTFIRDVVTKVKADACVDAKRVYAVGYSNGGGLTHLLGCRAADVFAAIAPAAFDIITESGECTPSRPITEISFRGLTDPVVPYVGGYPPAPPASYPLDPVHFLGAEATFEKWSQVNGCTGEPEKKGGNATNDCKTRSSCAGGTEVTLCSGSGSSGGHVTGDAAIGWAMLKQHAMP